MITATATAVYPEGNDVVIDIAYSNGDVDKVRVPIASVYDSSVLTTAVNATLRVKNAIEDFLSKKDTVTFSPEEEVTVSIDTKDGKALRNEAEYIAGKAAEEIAADPDVTRAALVTTITAARPAGVPTTLIDIDEYLIYNDLGA